MGSKPTDGYKSRFLVAEYLELQGRFKHLDDNAVQKIQEDIDKNWDKLMGKIDTAI